MKKLLIVLGSILSLLVVPGWSYELSAQTPVIRSAGGKSVQVVPGKTPSKPPAGKKGAKPPTASKSGAAKGEKGAAKKADEAPKTTKRPTKPDVPPDPKEFELRPSDDGKMKLSFKGQPWPQLLEWLAKVSNMSLDWQELPPDYLNLVSDRRYTVEEVQDLINRRLLSRGFTMLRNGEVLSVVNIKKLDPSMVPRVSPEELAQRNPHEFVRVSFRLNWLLAEQAVTEFEPMRSPNGKLTPLKETNRIEAMDAVINLREIYRLITEEQSGDSQKQLVKNFPLKHTRASKVLEQLKTLLGMEKSSKAAGPLTPQQIQAQQRAAAMARSQAGKGKTPTTKQKAEVYLVVNERDNSILVNAPPDKMAIVEQAIQIIDVPADASKSLLRKENMDRIRVYRLAALDPETLVKILEEVGSLDYDTRLEVDTKNKAVTAYASLVDHLTIQSLVDRLDGSGRSFEVIQLRRLESDYVAGTIESMMGGQEEKKKQSTSRFYGYYNPYGSRNQQDDKTDKFRVSGDVEFNRLLLWANEIELREVENLLVKLGEIPARGGNSSTMRVIDVAPGKETEELLKRLRKIWPSLGPNKLLLDSPAELKEKEEKRTQNAKPQVKPNLLKSTQLGPKENSESRLVIPVAFNDGLKDGLEKNVEVAQGDSEETSQQTQPRLLNEEGNLINPNRNSRNPNFLRNRRQTPGMKPPPISITRTPDGRLIISSQDTRALDRLEEVMTQMIPPRKDYRIFYIQYADAYWVMQNLEEYFEDEDDKKDNGRNSYYSYWYGYPSSNTSSAPPRLSRRKPLKFIYDLDTNTILAQGGDPQQLKTVEDLIKLYDKPRNTDTKMLRQTKLVSLNYAKAKIVADAVKDVYRDLLSANDKALINGPQKPKTESRYSYTYVYGDGEQSGQKIPKFKGALSVGVDETSNTLVLSAQPYLLKEVTDMVKALDEAAKPYSGAMQVVEIRNADAFRLQKSLSGVLSKKPAAGKSETKKPAQNGLKQGQTDQTKVTRIYN